MPRKKAGRPSDYTPEVATAICEQLIGGDSLRTICKADGMPDPATVYRWLAKEENSAFREQYARAREWQMEAMGEEALEIADDSSNDTILKELPGGNGQTVEIENREWVSRSKLRVETRKWFMSQLAPKKYGPNMTLKGDKSAPLTVNIDLGHD